MHLPISPKFSNNQFFSEFIFVKFRVHLSLYLKFFLAFNMYIGISKVPGTVLPRDLTSLFHLSNTVVTFELSCP